MKIKKLEESKDDSSLNTIRLLNQRAGKLITRSEKCQEELKKIQEKEFKEAAADMLLNQAKHVLLNVRVKWIIEIIGRDKI